VRTAGIDLAAADENTAVCVIDWNGAHPSVRFCTDTSDSALLEICRTVDKVGIDCPFGWPIPFVAAVSAHQDGLPWPGRGQPVKDFKHSLAFRMTDEHVRRVIGRAPLSVAADRIAWTAMRCALLLDELPGADRTGMRGPVAEVYPVASLHAWSLPTIGYKGMKKLHLLPGLLDQLLDRFPELALTPGERESCVATDHAFDALVCALTANEIVCGRTGRPEPGEASDRAAVEGWIHVPHSRTARRPSCP
jgi:hypothetical protein